MTGGGLTQVSPFTQPFPKRAHLSPTSGPVDTAWRPSAGLAIVSIAITASLAIRSLSSAEARAELWRLCQTWEPYLPQLLNALEVRPRAPLRSALARAVSERPGLMFALLLAVAAKARPDVSGPIMQQAATPYLRDALKGIELPLRLPQELFIERLKEAVVLVRADPLAWLDGCVDGDFTRALRDALRRDMDAEADYRRGAVRHQELPETLADKSYQSDVAGQVETRMELEAMWASLSAGERDVIRLGAQGYPDAEIALGLKITPGAARQRRLSVRKRLRGRTSAN